MQKLISVIIPVYNREKYIEECLNCIFDQEYQNFEIILVDDGSTDNTLEICESFAEKDSRVKIFAGEHRGVSAARNIALDNAKGDYVFFLDSDDVIHPLLLQSLVEALENNNVSIAATACVSISEKKWDAIEQIKAKFPGPADFEFYTYEEAIDVFFTNTKSPLNLIGGVMMKRDFVGDTRLNTDVFIGEDFLFVYENLVKGCGAAVLKQKWYYARHHEGNTSWNYTFDGFYTRYLRREIVWNNEEKLGRKKYANLQKRNTVFVFTNCLYHNELNSDDAKKMRSFMKKQKHIIKEFSIKDKYHFYLSVYLPRVYRYIMKMYKTNKGKKH